MTDLVIRSRRVVTPAGVRPATVHVADGRITRLGGWRDVEADDDFGSDADVVDAGDLVLMPGVVDTHVHVNEPGRTEWEGFESATRAAAAGGVTTILDMPLNAVPATTTPRALFIKQRAAQGKTAVNVGYIGGVVPGNVDQLEGLKEAGAVAFKCFLSPSGVDEFGAVNERELREAFPVLQKLGLPLMVHAEDPSCLTTGPDGGSRVYADYLASRPPEAERSAIRMLVRLMEQWPTPVHVVHLSSASSLDVIGDARARGLPLTVETCPHYLTFAAEEVPDGATEYKCAPPIRGAAEREALWAALADGRIDMIASDHSPCPPEMKRTDGDFFAAWGGIASLQLSLAAVWTGARERGHGMDRVARWMCAAPARLVGLGARRGALSAGRDADIVVWDPDARFTVDAAELRHRHPLTPYLGRTLHGAVRATYVAGELAYDGA